MKAKEAFQLGLFFLVLYLAWSSSIIQHAGATLTFLGALGGLLIHWGLTNKGNRDIINIRPLGAGFRVLVMDMVLMIAVLAGLKTGAWAIPLLLLGTGAVLIDYSVGG